MGEVYHKKGKERGREMSFRIQVKLQRESPSLFTKMLVLIQWLDELDTLKDKQRCTWCVVGEEAAAISSKRMSFEILNLILCLPYLKFFCLVLVFCRRVTSSANLFAELSPCFRPPTCHFVFFDVTYVKKLYIFSRYFSSLELCGTRTGLLELGD